MPVHAPSPRIPWVVRLPLVVLAVPVLTLFAVVAPGPGSWTAAAAPTDTTTTTAAPGTPPAAEPTPEATPEVTVVVQPGESLTRIAERLGVPGGWPALYDANRDAVGDDPDRLAVGTVLTVLTTSATGDTTSTTTQPGSYVVSSGETLRSIALALQVPGGWPALYEANRTAVGADPDRLVPGIRLALPAPSADTAASPDATPAPVPTPLPDAAEGSGPDTAPSTGPSTAPDSGATAADAPPVSGTAVDAAVPAWVSGPLVVVAVLAGLALVGDPLLALARRRRARRHTVGDTPTSSEPASEEPAAAPARALQVVPAPAPAVRGDDGPRVHVQVHRTLLVSHSPDDDLVVVLVPAVHDLDDVLEVARVALPERAYRAVERRLAGASAAEDGARRRAG